VVAVLEEVWSSIAEACEALAPPAWEQLTECPGWTVRDQLSHLVGTELLLLGEPPPPGPAEWPPHVRSEFGAVNEGAVELRRNRPGPEVLAEFVEVTQRRLAMLRGLSSADFDEIVASPIGRVPYRDFMWLRVFDSWVHEQDVRRAVGRPGGRGGGGEAETLRRVESMMPFVVGKRVAPPDGTVVRWDVSGPLPRTVTVKVEGGRGGLDSSTPGPNPTVSFVLPADAFWRFGCGRVTADDGTMTAVELDGDAALGRQVLEAMAFAP
jgi:uncharacterized protein (TIGR03083 family)